MKLLTGSFEKRLRKSISVAWQIFMEKVGGGQLSIEKEASMQEHYKSILQHVASLICFRENETVKIELKTDAGIPDKKSKVDLVLDGEKSQRHYKIAVEMRCYQEKNGGRNNFMKNVYLDLHRLEECCDLPDFNEGVSLVMNDQETLAHPKKKTGDGWDYDISDGTRVSNIERLKTKIGNNTVDIRLKKSYEFTWNQKGKFWFMELEGQ
ncbi:MAG: hypothetical protein ACR2PY_05055 [Salinispira sp.]